MRFTLRSQQNKQSKFFSTFWKLAAKQVIFCYPMRADEALLNKHLIQNYNISLKFACLKLLLNSKVSVNSLNETTVFWADKKDQQLARLITFGTGKVPGSKILLTIFS